MPGSSSTLDIEKAKGNDIRIVYSILDALEIAKNNTDKNVVFLGIGFETTTPSTAFGILNAKAMDLKNFTVFSAHKVMPPPMAALIDEDVKIVFTSAGNPKIWTNWLQERGITVVHVVSNVKFALKAQSAGVDAIVAEGFERIHRTNLVGMGVLPLEFTNGETRKTYDIDGTETFDVEGDISAGALMKVVMTRKNGEQVEIPVKCRLDTAEEVHVYDAGGVLQRFAQDFLESSADQEPTADKKPAAA